MAVLQVAFASRRVHSVQDAVFERKESVSLSAVRSASRGSIPCLVPNHVYRRGAFQSWIKQAEPCGRSKKKGKVKSRSKGNKQKSKRKTKIKQQTKLFKPALFVVRSILDVVQTEGS